MICPNCNKYAQQLFSLCNGPYKVCPLCNEKFLYYDFLSNQLIHEARVDKESAKTGILLL